MFVLPIGMDAGSCIPYASQRSDKSSGRLYSSKALLGEVLQPLKGHSAEKMVNVSLQQLEDGHPKLKRSPRDLNGVPFRTCCSPKLPHAG